MDSDTFFKWKDSSDISHTDLAEKLGVDSRTLSVYKSRGLPKSKLELAAQIVKEWEDQGLAKSIVAVEYTGEEFDEIDAAAKLIDVSFRDFIVRSSIARAREEMDKVNLSNVTPINLVAEDAATYKPHTIIVPGTVAAGTGQDSDFAETRPVAKLYPEHYRGVDVRGDSMDHGKEGAIPDGCLAIIDTQWRDAPYAAKNKIYAWSTPDGQVVKKFERLKANGVSRGFLTSLNPKYAPIPYEDTFIVQGEVVAVEC